MLTLSMTKQFVLDHKRLFAEAVVAALVLALMFIAGWKACQRFDANVVEVPTVVTEVKEVKVPVASETKTEVRYVEKDSARDADVQIDTGRPQVVVDYNGQQTKFATLDNETQKFDHGKLKVEQESKTVLDVTPIVEREVKSAVEENTRKLTDEKNKAIKEERKKHKENEVGAFIAGVVGGVVLHAAW